MDKVYLLIKNLKIRKKVRNIIILKLKHFYYSQKKSVNYKLELLKNAKI